MQSAAKTNSRKSGARLHRFAKAERTIAFVNLQQIRLNLKAIIALARKSNGSSAIKGPKAGALQVVPMVKCNAYGHGLEPVTKALQEFEEVEAFGVATFDEAIALRRARVKKSLWVFSEGLPWTDDLADLCFRYNLTPVLHNLEDIRKALRQESRLRRFHVKINTGLNRLGVDLKDVSNLANLLRKAHTRQFEGICTHFAAADLPKSSLSQDQSQAFRYALSQCAPLEPKHVHAAATAALPHLEALGLKGICTSIRPGLALFGYGLSVVNPALKWRVRVLKTRLLAPGNFVGYGGSFAHPRSATKPISQAIVACGYGDGLHRSLSNQSMAGRAILGRVSMDMTAIEGFGLRAGQWLTIFGDEQGQAEKLAGQANTIVYELLTSLSARVPRVYSSY